MATEYAPSSMYRSSEGVGVWEHRGKVAAVGVGHSPTERRWDESPFVRFPKRCPSPPHRTIPCETACAAISGAG